MVSSFVDILPLFMTAKYIHDSNVIISGLQTIILYKLAVHIFWINLKLEVSLKVN